MHRFSGNWKTAAKVSAENQKFHSDDTKLAVSHSHAESWLAEGEDLIGRNDVRSWKQFAKIQSRSLFQDELSVRLKFETLNPQKAPNLVYDFNCKST